MSNNAATDSNAAGRAAARWFVRRDAGAEPRADAELAAWLAEHPAHERAMERIELAVELGRRLAAEPAHALHAEAVRAAQGRPRAALARNLAWTSALAAAVLVGVWIALPDGRGPVPAAPEPVTLEAARLVAFAAPTSAVAVLPSGVVVDAGAVAVLPFAAVGDPTLARGLERDVVAALRGVPGLYVIADRAARPYAATDLTPAEIGAQLGARGIVEATVELADGRVRASARLREAATGAALWQIDFDRPLDELNAVRDEIAEHVAASMLDLELRALLADTRASGPLVAAANAH